MDALATLWSQSDAVGRAVALLLLAMSVASWALIAWKTWVLRRARRDLAQGVPLFWEVPVIDTPAVMAVIEPDGEVRGPVRIAEAVGRGHVSVPHGWGDTNVNVLTSKDDVDPLTGMPLYSTCATEVEIQRANANLRRSGNRNRYVAARHLPHPLREAHG